VNTRELRGVFGLFATGVTVVSCRNIDDGRPHGATVTAFTPISLEPALCQVTLTRTSKACQFLDGQPFAVNVLAENQADVAWHFAGRPASPLNGRSSAFSRGRSRGLTLPRGRQSW
jgi:flavin reductase (DIM6/NTAB) family NADH-FMN oxidoreductase RutF